MKDPTPSYSTVKQWISEYKKCDHIQNATLKAQLPKWKIHQIVIENCILVVCKIAETRRMSSEREVRKSPMLRDCCDC